MDLNKTQGRQLIPTAGDKETSSSTLDNPDDPKNFRREEKNYQDNQALYALRNKTIRCTVFEQYRAYLKCPECPEYDECAQLKRKQRIELETSPNNDGMNLDDYKDVEEVLVVTKAFRRKVIWAPVSIEQVKANQGNGGSMKEPENLIKNEGDAALAQQKVRKGAVKAKNEKKN